MPLPTLQVDPTLDDAIALYRRRELAASRRLCEAILERARAEGSGTADLVAAPALYWATRCARRQECTDEALRLVYDGLAAARRSGQGRIECLLRAELVHILSALGQNDDAFEQAEIGLGRARASNDPVGTAAAREALASIYWMTADWEAAQQAFVAAHDLARACDNLDLLVLCTMGLAAAEEGLSDQARAAGRIDDAHARATRSVQLQRDGAALATELGDEYLVMYCELNRGCSLQSLGTHDEAEAVFRSCLDDPGRAAIHGNAMARLGQVALAKGDSRTAVAHLLRALPMVESLNKPYPVLVVLESLVDAYEALGDARSALATMRRFHALYVQNASEKSRLMARAMSVKYDTERAHAVAEAQRQRADQLERSNAELASEAAVHERAAMQDGLTGIANRRRFDQSLRARLKPDGRLASCSVALLDLDHFKQINDRFSHLVGDQVLRRIAALLSANCRRGDLAARYGGEEFVLLGTDLAREDMPQLCERVRLGVEQEDWSRLHAGLRVTVSIGVAHHAEIDARSAAAIDGLLALADARLYRAKDDGRNRVCHEG